MLPDFLVLGLIRLCLVVPRNSFMETVGSGNNAEILKKLCNQLFNDNGYSNIDRMLYLTNHDANFNHNVKLSDMYE